MKDGEANSCNATLIAPIKGSVNQRVKNDIIQQINDYPTDELVLTKHTALSTYQRFTHTGKLSVKPNEILSITFLTKHPIQGEKQ